MREPTVQCIRKKGRNPYFRLRVGGKDHHLGTDMAVAYKRAGEILGGLGRRAGAPSSIAELYRRWCQEAKPNHNLARAAGRWVEDFATDAPFDILHDPLVLHAYGDYLDTRDLKPSTINRYTSTARVVCRWAAAQGWIDKPPDSAPHRKEILHPRDESPENIAKAWSTLNPTIKRVATFILTTGCRPSEAISLTWEQVRMEKRVCVLDQHKTAAKTRRPRTIYLPPQAMEVLESIPEPHSPGELVFHNCRGGPWKRRSLSRSLSRHGIRGVYTLRHTAAQTWLEAGTPIEVVAKLLGHVDLKMVQVYAQVRSTQLQRAAETLPTLIPTAPGVAEQE